MQVTAITLLMELNRFWKAKSIQITRNLIAYHIPPTKSRVKIDPTPQMSD
jgi:hypothetical protein